MKQKTKNIRLRNIGAAITVAIVLVGAVLLIKSHQALSATITKDGPLASNLQIFAFPAATGSSEFDVVSLPETTYSESKPGSALFTAYDGTSQASNYINFVHMGRKSETSDTFMMQFFNQEQCITNPDGTKVPGAIKELKFDATFTKPNLTPTPAGQPVTKITIRSYDHFLVTWGNGQYTVKITRYWRAITLPSGTTPSTFRPGDYFNDGPRDSDVASPQVITKTLLYTGDFAPFSTRITQGLPFDTNAWELPSEVEIPDINNVPQRNEDFNFYNITNIGNDNGVTAAKVVCRLDDDTLLVEKTQPCGCLNSAETKTCGDPEQPFTDMWPPVQFSLAGGTDWQIKNVSELRNSISMYGEQFANDGQVRLKLNSYDASQNSKYSATALAMNYRTDIKQLYFSWCFNGNSQQGLVAGGERITETKSTAATLDADSSGCCDYVTRTPVIDKTGADSEGRASGGPDGIDDDWQLKYGFKLTGKQGYMLPTNYDGDAPGQGNASGVQGDGFIANQFLDLNGKPIALTPASVNSKTGQKYETGDGKFAAGEEYVWGTDPTQNDSDLDGFPDEADIVGVGQQSVDFVSEQQPRDFPKGDNETGNDRVKVKIKVLGETEQKRSETKNAADAQTETGLDLQNVVRVSEDEQNIFSRDEGNMSVSLVTAPESPGLNDTLNVTSSLVLGTRLGGNPMFQWFAKRIPGHNNNPGTGQPSGSVPFLQGENINKFSKVVRELCPECQPGDELLISVQVDDTVRGQVASANSTVLVGGDNSLQVFQDCNKDGTDDEVGSATYCFHSAQVTKDIPVRVSASFFNIDSSEYNSYYFEWKFDGVKQVSNCLLPNVQSSGALQKCGLGTNQMVFKPLASQKEYPVELTVYRNNREGTKPAEYIPTPNEQIAHYTATISSGIPQVTVVFEPAATASDGSYPAGTALTARAYVDFLNPNPKAQLTADPNVLGTVDGNKALRYVWKDFTGKIIKVEELNSINGSSIPVDTAQPGVAEVSVEVTSPDYTSSGGDGTVPVTISDNSSAYVVSGAASNTLASRLSARFASLVGFVPEPFMRVVKVAAIVTFGAVLVLGFASVPQFKKRKG